MEVHHHAHPAPAGHRKKWSHYFWEFLMLFLAVFCGFIAENQREHLVEHKREKEFMRSLVQDLKSDITQSNQTLIRLQATKNATDSILLLMSEPEFVQNTSNVYRLWSTHLGFADFFSNDRTIQQLKNSGSLRLIRKKNVSDSIMQYDRVVRDYNGQDDLMSRSLTNQEHYYNLFDFINLDKNKTTGIPVPLTEKGKQELNNAYAERKIWSFAFASLIKRLKVVNETAVRTLELIKKEYHLK